MNTYDTSLPEGFEELEAFAAEWALPENMQRYTKRVNSPMAFLQAFYNAVQPRAEEALEYLNQFPLKDLKGPEERLMHLLLMLIDVSLSIEVYGVSSLPLSPAPERYEVEMSGMYFQ